MVSTLHHIKRQRQRKINGAVPASREKEQKRKDSHVHVPYQHRDS